MTATTPSAPVQNLLGRLEDVKRSGPGWIARCPSHDDRVASLSINQGDDGCALLHCHAGCDAAAVMAALDMPLSDLFLRRDIAQTSQRRIVATYDYTDKDGNLLYQVVRFAPKDFRQRTPNGNDGWTWKLNGVRPTLYHLPRLIEAGNVPVHIVEGEEDVHTLENLGLVATCNSGGAKKWKDRYADMLRGRHIAIIPDNDPPGRAHGEQIAKSCYGKAASIIIVELPNVPPSGDVTDWVTTGGTAELLSELIAAAQKYEPKRESATHTHAGLVVWGTIRTNQAYASERFENEHGDNVRYCRERDEWYVWDGRRWKPDRIDHVLRLAKDTILNVYAVASRSDDDDKRAKLIRLANSCDTNHGYRDIVSGASYLGQIPITADELDTDPWMLNCESGTLNLRSGELHPHDPKNMISKLAPVQFNPEARHELWDRFLNESTQEDKELAAFLQRAAGYSLTGSTAEEKLFFVHGPAASGKSTFVESLKATLGDYSSMADFETFLERKHAGGPRNDIARLAGARFVASVEVSDGRRLAQGLVKLLTGGDTVAARFLYRESFEFIPQFKLWLAANHTPRVDSGDSAMWRRIARIPFERTIPKHKRDPKVKATLKSDPEARAAILAWAVAGCTAWQCVGLKVPESVEDATEAYRQDQDDLRDFFDECCVIEAGCWTEAARLRKAYAQFCDEMRIKYAIGPKAFAERLRDHGCCQEKRNDRRGWAGIEMVDRST